MVEASSRRGKKPSQRLVVAATMVYLATASCGSPTQTADPDDIATSVNALYIRIMGDPTERKAGQLIVYHQMQDPMVDCLKAAGFEYTPPPFVVPNGGWKSTIGAESWLTPLQPTSIVDPAYYTYTPARAQEDAHGTFPNPGFERLDEDGKRAYTDAQTACIVETEGTGTGQTFPKEALELGSAFTDVISKIDNSAAMKTATDEYGPCMRQAGFDVATRVELLEQIQPRFRREHPAGAGVAETSGWDALVALDLRAATADVSCRADIYALGMQLVQDDMEAFVADHADDLQRVDDAWAGLVKKASAYPEW